MAIRSKIRNLNERWKDALWASFAAVLLSYFGLLSPLDQTVWIYQSILNKEPVSGEIAFATSRESLSDPGNPRQRERLADALDAIAASEVDHVYLDVVFDRPSTQQADEALAQSIENLGARVTLVRRVVMDVNGVPIIDTSINAIAGDAQQVASERFVNYLGFTWTMPMSVQTDAGEFASLPAAMSGRDAPVRGDIPVSYDFDASSITVLNVDALTDAALLESLDNKVVLIGDRGLTQQDLANIPGLPGVPGSYVSLFSAETLKAGYTSEIRSRYTLSLYVFGLALILFFLGSRSAARKRAYALLALTIPALLLIVSFLHVRIGIAGAIVFLAWYSALRVRSRWQKRFALEDEKTGLPTFRAFEKAISEKGNPGAIIIAKVNGYEDVVKALPPDQHAQYVRSLVERFRVGEKDMPIYVSDGRYFAWSSSQTAAQELDAHLDGLRALFSTPIKVGDTELDAGITFGVDTSGEPNPARRLASAVSASEQTDEAHRPVVFAEQGTDSDALWKLSLQGRIDRALNSGEIYLVYQPKVDVVTGEMVGVEALVRWDDPSRGPIAPTFFIQECERAGRMDHLTQFVLNEAVDAAVNLRGHGIDTKMSVNISATLLRDSRVERMVKQVLDENNLPAHLLVLEVTETARILDLDHAVAVLDRLRDIGVSISIDDFGVGAANLETIYKLPLDELKIDREFVANIDHPKAAAVVASVITFGKATGITIVAEGAEDRETIRKLASQGCKIVQGYGISRPIRFADLLEFQWDSREPAIKNMV